MPATQQRIDAVRVFSCTKHAEREQLGERITSFIRQLPAGVTVVDKRVVQSSDAQFHCVSVVLYFRVTGV
jgi:hypothetical protein